MKKYLRIKMSEDKKSICPKWDCAILNDHVTGQVCRHVQKVTKKGIVYYLTQKLI